MTTTTDSQLLVGIGIELPLRPAAGQLLRTAAGPKVMPQLVSCPALDCWQDAAGRVLMTNPQAKTAECPDNDDPATAITVLKRLLPALAAVTIDEIRPAIRPIPGDGRPAVGETRVPGLWLGCTHSGMTLAPLVGSVLADEISTGILHPTFSAYRPTRFNPF